MEAPSKEEVVAVLSDILREALSRGDSVEVPGFGVFEVRHQSSGIEEQPDGALVMVPPRDEVRFTPLV